MTKLHNILKLATISIFYITSFFSFFTIKNYNKDVKLEDLHTKEWIISSNTTMQIEKF